jgi:transcriptional regulator with XRE-family HTH domain
MANKIKEYAKFKDISLKTLLEDLQLGSNTFSHMKHGRMIAADSLAKIADYLDCSVDYLLGRTDDPAISSRSDTTLNLTAHEQEIVAAYRSHPETQPAVDKLLGVTEDGIIVLSQAAKSAENRKPGYEQKPVEKWTAIENAPETDEDLL